MVICTGDSCRSLMGVLGGRGGARLQGVEGAGAYRSRASTGVENGRAAIPLPNNLHDRARSRSSQPLADMAQPVLHVQDASRTRAGASPPWECEELRAAAAGICFFPRGVFASL